jgi:hypothetical protein
MPDPPSDDPTAPLYGSAALVTIDVQSGASSGREVAQNGSYGAPERPYDRRRSRS